jgi:hypothetical protein
MHKSQSNVTIAMTEFDSLRELNAYAIDIARDYFAMAANDPRLRDRQGNTETEPAAVLNGAGGVGVAPSSTRNSVAEEKRKQNRVIMRRQWSATSEVVQFDYERSKAVA